MAASESLERLDAVLTGLHTLAETAESVEDAMVRQRMTGTIVGLRAVILTVREHILEMQTAYEQLLLQNRPANEAGAAARREPLRMKWGCYQFDETEAVYCKVCYDTKRRKVRAMRYNSTSVVCPICRKQFPTQ